VDAQNFRGLPALFSAILRSLPERGFRDQLRETVTGGLMVAETLRKKLADLLQTGRDNLGADDEADLLAYWSIIAPAVGERLAASQHPFVLCFDELPMLFQDMVKRPNGVDTANRLLAGLRNWREHPRVAMLFTGSIGMRGLAKAHGIDRGRINDLTDIQLRPLPRDEAKAMLRALVAGAGGRLTWTDDIVEAVLNRLAAFHPSLIQYAFRRLHADNATTLPALDRVFRDDIRPGVECNFFNQFTDRLHSYPAPLRGQLDRTLATVARADGPLREAAFFEAVAKGGDQTDDIEDLLAILREDGFLDWNSEDRTLDLADGMVRAWWRSRPRG
jgi:hypothetical protein